MGFIEFKQQMDSASGDPLGGILSGGAAILGTTLGLPAIGGLLANSGLGAGAAAVGGALKSAGDLNSIQGWWNAYNAGQSAYNTGQVGNAVAAIGTGAIKTAAEEEMKIEAKKRLLPEEVKLEQTKEDLQRVYFSGISDKALKNNPALAKLMIKDPVTGKLMANPEYKLSKDAQNAQNAQIRIQQREQDRLDRAEKNANAQKDTLIKNAETGARQSLERFKTQNKITLSSDEENSFLNEYKQFYIDRNLGLVTEDSPTPELSILPGSKRKWNYAPKNTLVMTPSFVGKNKPVKNAPVVNPNTSTTGAAQTFIVNGTSYTIPEEKVAEFKKDHNIK
jgi:hypothetical protein